MCEALSGLPGVVCMRDDVLIRATTGDEHDECLKKVLSLLEGLGMTLNFEKCLFVKSSVKFLGHVVDSSGIRPDPSKVSAIFKDT